MVAKFPLVLIHCWWKLLHSDIDVARASCPYLSTFGQYKCGLLTSSVGSFQ